MFRVSQELIRLEVNPTALFVLLGFLAIPSGRYLLHVCRGLTLSLGMGSALHVLLVTTVLLLILRMFGLVAWGLTVLVVNATVPRVQVRDKLFCISFVSHVFVLSGVRVSLA